ncbi:MAG TPA: transposase [Acidiferrobacterales bacterium]|nr:transposase [Acidiferrobacterales bacterium]
MARLPRYGLPGQPQHVIQRGNNRAVLFATDTDYQFFRDCLTDACTRHGCRVHAYVFMTNHVHLLMTPDHEDAIGKVMQSVGRRYVQYFNFTYQRTGTLWEGRYRATPIDTERYLLTCYRYIELNPIRAGIVDEPRNYRWSSHGCNAFGKADRLVTVHDQYAALGSTDSERQAAYRTLFRERLAEPTLDAIREATNKGWALGSDKFKEEIEGLLQRRTRPLPKGGVRNRKQGETEQL